MLEEQVGSYAMRLMVDGVTTVVKSSSRVMMDIVAKYAAEREKMSEAEKMQQYYKKNPCEAFLKDGKEPGAITLNKEDAQKIYCYYADGTTALSGYLFKGETRYDNIFEPLDEWKGNIARALFYMATRYGKRNEVNTQEEPYLYFSNEDVFNTDEDFVGTQRYLDTLLDWDKIDPVDDYEIKRNNLIFNNVQRNRNPFVDIQNLSSAVFKNEVLSEVKINVQGQTPTPVDPIKPEEPEEKKDIPVWIIILIVVGVLLVASTVIGIGVTKSRKKRR